MVDGWRRLVFALTRMRFGTVTDDLMLLDLTIAWPALQGEAGAARESRAACRSIACRLIADYLIPGRFRAVQ